MGRLSGLTNEAVAQKVSDQIRGINFPNFKNQVSERDRHDA
jgi:hypothetical protein